MKKLHELILLLFALRAKKHLRMCVVYKILILFYEYADITLDICYLI